MYNSSSTFDHNNINDDNPTNPVNHDFGKRQYNKRSKPSNDLPNAKNLQPPPNDRNVRSKNGLFIEEITKETVQKKPSPVNAHLKEKLLDTAKGVLNRKNTNSTPIQSSLQKLKTSFIDSINEEEKEIKENQEPVEVIEEGRISDCEPDQPSRSSKIVLFDQGAQNEFYLSKFKHDFQHYFDDIALFSIQSEEITGIHGDFILCVRKQGEKNSNNPMHSGWVIKARRGYRDSGSEFQEDFEAEHPEYGIVKGRFADTILFTSYEGLTKFMTWHSPELCKMV